MESDSVASGAALRSIYGVKKAFRQRLLRPRSIAKGPRGPLSEIRLAPTIPTVGERSLCDHGEGFCERMESRRRIDLPSRGGQRRTEAAAAAIAMNLCEAAAKAAAAAAAADVTRRWLSSSALSGTRLPVGGRGRVSLPVAVEGREEGEGARSSGAHGAPAAVRPH